MNTPYYTVSAQGVVDQYERMKGFADTVNYSAKTNYDLVPVLEQRTDAGFSIHFERALSYLDDTSRATYFVQGTDEDQLSRLAGAGVTTLVIDNTADLQRLTAWLDDANVSVTVFLRLKRKEHSVETGKHYVFGMSSKTVNEATADLHDHDNVESVGVHVHRKTQNVAEWRLRDELSDALTETTLRRLDHLNAGGGFPVRYKNYQRDTMPGIRQRFNDLHEWASSHGIELIIEPGRIIAAPPGKLHTTVINVYDDTVVVDASVYNAAMDTVATNTRLEIEEEQSEGTGHHYTVKGRTPDSIDIIRYKAWLDDPRRGDTLTFTNATAYNYSSDFCDLPKPPTKLTE